jgi:hypothetical protein
MTTATKTKNGKVTAEGITEAAGKFTKEAKAAADTWFEVTGKAVTETKTILDAQQKMVQDAFATWQKYAQANGEFFTQASQQMFAESLVVGERWNNMAQDNRQKAFDLWQAEQDAAVETAQAFWNQSQAASEQMFTIFTPVFK